jgi:hypothetical protein
MGEYQDLGISLDRTDVFKVSEMFLPALWKRYLEYQRSKRHRDWNYVYSAAT